MYKSFKQNIALFYVILILIFKVVGLHALTHLDDNDTDVQHCEVCHIVTTVSLTPILKTESPVFTPKNFYVRETKITGTAICNPHYDRYLTSYLFTRPPPKFI